MKLKLTTLPRIFIHVVCRFSSIHCIRNPAGFLACHSVPVMAIARAVPTGGPRYYSGSASCRCMRMREYVDPT